jgi:hypothetical protein
MATGDGIPDLTWLDAILFVGIPAFFGGILQVSYEWSYGSLFSEEQSRTGGDVPPETKRAFAVELFTGGLFGLARGSRGDSNSAWI